MLSRPERDTPPEPIAACVNCGYDIRQFSDGTACPECGFAVDVSRTGARLDTADPQYFRKLAFGRNLLRASIIIAVVWVVVVLAPLVLPTGVRSKLPLTTLSLILFPLALLSVVGGWFFLTSPDSRFVGFEYPSSVRRWARSFANAVVALMLVVVGVTLFAPGHTSVVGGVLVSVALAAIEACWYVGTALGAIHVQTIARREGDQRLARVSRDLALAVALNAVAVGLAWLPSLPYSHPIELVKGLSFVAVFAMFISFSEVLAGTLRRAELRRDRGATDAMSMPQIPQA